MGIKLGYAEVNRVNIKDFIQDAVRYAGMNSQDWHRPTDVFLPLKVERLLVASEFDEGCKPKSEEVAERIPEGIPLGRLMLADLGFTQLFGCHIHSNATALILSRFDEASGFEMIFEVPTDGVVVK